MFYNVADISKNFYTQSSEKEEVYLENDEAAYYFEIGSCGKD